MQARIIGNILRQRENHQFDLMVMPFMYIALLILAPIATPTLPEQPRNE
jgi:hypothetical protein